MSKDEALRLALRAMVVNNQAWKYLADSGDAGNFDAEEQGYYQLNEQAITAVEAALEAKDEPAAWMYPDDLKRFETSEAYAEAYSIEMVSPTQGETVPLYTAPPQRTWVGLTTEEREQVQTESYGKVPHHVALIAAVEARLKDKNT